MQAPAGTRIPACGFCARTLAEGSEGSPGRTPLLTTNRPRARAAVMASPSGFPTSRVATGSARPPVEIGGEQPRRGQAMGLGSLKASGVRDHPHVADPSLDGDLQDHVRGPGSRSFDPQAERARSAVAAATQALGGNHRRPADSAGGPAQHLVTRPRCCALLPSHLRYGVSLGAHDSTRRTGWLGCARTPALATSKRASSSRSFSSQWKGKRQSVDVATGFASRRHQDRLSARRQPGSSTARRSERCDRHHHGRGRDGPSYRSRASPGLETIPQGPAPIVLRIRARTLRREPPR